MNRHNKPMFLLLIAAGIVVLGYVLLHGHHIDILQPAGIIASKERKLIFIALALSLFVVIPVFALTFGIVWRYRADNKHARYMPEWDHNRQLEMIWWGLPTLLITILAVIAWQSSHDLDPFRNLNSDVKPLKVQVVSLQWKWLFIYPEQRIASVNFVEFPVSTPVSFEITSDAPMNSFWIPRLGGQIYAMSGMSTYLHLMADQTGNFAGSSANISGSGFAGMKFIAKSSSQSDFDAWIKFSQSSSNKLDDTEYAKLAAPSTNNQPVTYALTTPNLYDKVVLKYMSPNLNQPGLVGAQ